MASSAPIRVPSPLSLREQPPTVHGRTAMASFTDDDSSAPNTPTLAPERPSGGFILRIPASAGLGGHGTPSHRSSAAERDDSPALTPASVGKRKRRNEPIGDTIAATRPRRGRPSTASPYVGDGIGTGTPSRDVSSAPSSRANSTAPPHNALSIFAAPTPSDISAEAQTIVGPSVARRERERLASEREKERLADESIARARPTRGGETHVRSGVSASGRGRRVGSRVQSAKSAPRAAKGKGKAEPDFVNQDFCSSCRGIGRFLCCDGCPRSFHFMCLDPPHRIDELPDSETWYCNKCAAERNPASANESPARAKDHPIAAVFQQLARRSENENPTQFRLPQEIRQFFVGVTAGPLGEYVDTEGARNKLDRKGFQEERDPLRLRDGKSRPVQCYKCGGSSVPTRSLASDVGAQWRPIVSCDYCNLHWHLDCLSPPLASMPSASRRWMCPNHSDQVMPHRRTVRNGLQSVEVESVGARNNGNVVVVETQEPQETLSTDDMVINNKKYRVPEKIIQLDFWNKLKQGTNRRGEIEAPATIDRRERKAKEAIQTATKADIEAAHFLLGLSMGGDDGESDGEAMDVDGDEHGRGQGYRNGSAAVNRSVKQIKAEAVSSAPSPQPNGNGTRHATPNPAPLSRPASTYGRPNGLPKRSTRRSTPVVNGSKPASPASSPAPRPPTSADGRPRITLRLNSRRSEE